MKKIEQEVQIEAEYALAGTLTLPDNGAEKHPVVIMVHGTGEVDRDENARRMPINVFKEMSDLAVDHGFATLRYDKRGIGKSEGSYLEMGLYDLIDDAEQVVRFADVHPAIDGDKVILLGHSEGCVLAPAVHRKRHVQGMIMLAGAAEPLAETTAWQREALKHDIRSKTGFEGFILRLLKVDEKMEKMNDQMMEKITSTSEPVVRFKGKKVNAKWNREHGNFDVREYLGDITCPVIAITGTKDVQVKSGDAAKICDLTGGPCESHIIPDLTHFLRKTDKENSISKILNDYKNQVKKPVDEEVKGKVGAWLDAWRHGKL